MTENKTADDKRSRLKECLEKIGWSMRGLTGREFIFDHNGKNTGFWVLSERVEDNNQKAGLSVSFYFKGSEVEMIGEGCVSLGTKECFVLFMNHNIKHTQ